MSTFRSVLGAAVLLATLGQGDGEEARFEKEYGRVQQQMVNKRWKKARASLLELLGEHPGERYVLAREAEIRRDLERCSFWMDHPAPPPAELVSGELLSYRRSTGAIKLRYRPGNLQDFERSRSPLGALVHPLTFDGSYSIELDLPKYPSHAFPSVLIGFDTEVPIQVVFGLKKSGRGNLLTWLPAKIIELRDGGAKLLADKENPQVVGGEPARLRVTVKSGSVAAYCNGRKLVSARRPKGLYGRIAVLNPGSFRELVISGTAQSSWIDGLEDAATQERWSAFEQSFEVDRLLPDWFRAPEPEARASIAAAYPGERSELRDVLLAETVAHLEAGEVQAALAAATGVAAKRGGEPYRSYLTTLVYYETGDLWAAADSSRRLVELAPAHAPSLLLRGEVLLALGRAEEAAEELDRWDGEPPASADLVELQVRAWLRAGRVERAQAALEAGIEGGAHAASLRRVGELVTQVLHGPRWDEVYEVKTKNYHVVSNLDRETCFEVGQVLEESLQRFNRDLRRLPRSTRRYKVYLFAGQAGFQAYLSDTYGTRRENVAGLYRSDVDQLLLWNLPDRDELLRTTRHEGFHQYFDRLVPQSPRWLNEGLAEYYENIRSVGGSWHQDLPNERHLAAIRRRSNRIALRDFLHASPAEFYAHPKSYPQAWALVHFLLHSTDEARSDFDELIDRLIAGENPSRALAAVFGSGDLETLERAFGAHLNEL
ncbi:MAG: DUF1570 domain-containing protein [Planctomycetota bacterium]